MSLFEALREECILIKHGVYDKASTLKEIAKLAKKSSILRDIDEETIYRELNEREKHGTTGFGKGIAIPHCVIQGIDKFVVGILSCPDGVDFKALDGKPVKILVFIVGPSANRNQYIHLLSAVSRVLNNETTVKELLSTDNPSSLRESFLSHVVCDDRAKDQTERALFHLFIQDESKFEGLLQIFAEIEGCSISVIEANDASYYLSTLPMFSGFLSEYKKGYNRIIVATTKKALTNEILRQISMVTGGLHENVGIMVTVQDVLFHSGSLNY